MEDEFTAAEIPRKLGIIGFCYGGGRVVEVLARDQNSTFGAGVSFYGTSTDMTAAQNVKVPVLFITGDNDPLCPVDTLAELEKTIGKGSRVVVFNGRGHGFVHRPESPEEDADAEEAFMIMRTWLYDHLLAS
uniref:Carboxymethylenebutenolidase homolog n=1 Tax=Opuntia streptacantha TaxID=393608 RepID=A0A7C9E6W9_OPUST